MIDGNDALSDGEDEMPVKETDELSAVDLQADDDGPDASIPARLTFSTSDNQAAAAMDKLPGASQTIEIQIDSFEKKGDGISAYIVFKISTKTQNVPGYANREYVVWRRFSDFLGLHEKLMDKYFCKGYLVPSAPEKSIATLTKTKMGANNEDNTNNEFVERRARSLQSFCRRIARHPKLVSDCDFRDFLTMDVELPKAVNTGALTGASMKRMLKTVGDAFSRMAFHMDENDRWFESAQHEMDEIEQSLTKILRSLDSMSACRRELHTGTDAFSRMLSMLASCEQDTGLARTLSRLSGNYENIALIHRSQSDQDCALLIEVFNEQLQTIYTFKELFFERVKVLQSWQATQQNLTRKREIKARYELSGRPDKVTQMMDELNNAERSVDEAEKDFSEVSKIIRGEYEMFLSQRKQDFRRMIIQYLKSLLGSQQQLLQHWESFAIQAKQAAKSMS